MRFSLQADSTIAVVTEGDNALLELGSHIALHFPQTRSGLYAGPNPVNGQEAVTEVEAIRQKGAQFLLIPAPSLWWLDLYTDLRDYLGRRYRVVLFERDTCAIFALHDPPDADVRRQGASDGLPLPPPELICATTNSFNSVEFIMNGERGAEAIKRVLSKNGLDLGSFEAILDFGCGCGRLIRQWRWLEGPQLFGVDYNPYFIDWCSKNLSFASFERSQLAARLSFDDERFDFVYAISVFTHLDVELQAFWIKELARVVRPGGYLLTTVHGANHADTLSSEDHAKFEAGELVVRKGELSGTNACAAFHPERYIRESMTDELDVVDLIPVGADDVNQDQILFRKPGR